MRVQITEPDGTAYTLAADHGVVRLTRSTGWSSTTWSLGAVSSRAIADGLHDAADHLEEMENNYS